VENGLVLLVGEEADPRAQTITMHGCDVVEVEDAFVLEPVLRLDRSMAMPRTVLVTGATVRRCKKRPPRNNRVVSRDTKPSDLGSSKDSVTRVPPCTSSGSYRQRADVVESLRHDPGAVGRRHICTAGVLAQLRAG
jgi:hypothetical protein